LDADEALFFEIAATRAFKRLNGISFLGAIDYLIPRPNGKAGSRRYSRQQHSVGVARLAVHYCNLLGMDFKARRLAYAAGLLHDIGHAPLSHSLEPVFREEFGVDHHRATALIITGCAIDGEVAATLKRFGIDQDELLSLLDGKHDPFQGFFSGPINFDTIEAILRTLTYNESPSSLLSPIVIVTAATQRQTVPDQEIVDEFWRLKDRVYRYIINSVIGVVADKLSQAFMRREIGKFSASDYFSTENDIFTKMPDLRSALDRKELLSMARELLPPKITYDVRKFDIEARGNFFTREDTVRYTQRRSTRGFDIGSMAGTSEAPPFGASFNDGLREHQGILGTEAPGFAGWDHWNT
jgi:uncharacterized protein